MSNPTAVTLLLPLLFWSFLLSTSNAFLLTAPNNRRNSQTSLQMKKLPKFSRRALLASTLLASAQFAAAQLYARPGCTRIPTQFIAALGDPKSSSGSEASEWGIWTEDPGPRGVYLKAYQQLDKNLGYAPAGWIFSKNDWWLEEHGIIMEAPYFPLAPGRYLVTGGRVVTTVLEIGTHGQWSLESGTLYDVTHLPCRSARYKPNEGQGSPEMAKLSDFPVMPGAAMPEVLGCDKQDYAVIFVIGKEQDSNAGEL